MNFIRDFDFEIGEDKYSGKKDIAIKIAKDYWISSLLENFLDKGGYLSEVELVLIGMLSSSEETYDSIYDKIQKIKKGVEEKTITGPLEFTLSL